MIISAEFLSDDMLRIMDPKTKGPSVRYTDGDLMHVLLVISEYQRMRRRISRRGISEITDIGVGIVRSTERKLLDMGLIDLYSTGATLTETGSGIISDSGLRMLRIGYTDAAIGKNQAAVLLRGRAGMVTNGIRQRNDGLKAGGDGCTAIVYREGELLMPPTWSVDERFPALARELRQHGLEDDDLVLIGGSDTDVRTAAAAALHAAMCLL